MADLQALPLFPLHTVLYPGMPLPLHIFEERYKLMIGECIEDTTPFGVVLIREGREVGEAAIPHDIGTSALVTNVEYLPGGRLNIDSIGFQRIRIHELRHDQPYLVGLVEEFPLEGIETPEVARLVPRMQARLHTYLLKLADAFHVSGDIQELPDDPAALAFLAAIVLNLPSHEKQDLLVIPDAPTLLSRELNLLAREASLVDLMLSHERQARDTNTLFSNN